ncbi:hypothetical protein HPB50_020775 [Hyalomma asiaticum]|uniref:Uncharacterized protein n=1 Tax=Hyalomma asiaticum TaxID=266040 RepID=A0ACB7RNT3_HYAAI|nr:hypothetical protein HPB50_020775 [Hyalomma asiaticum]
MVLAKVSSPTVQALLSLTLVSTVSCLGEHRLHRNQVDAFEVADFFPDAVAVYTSSDDPSLECLYANRTEYVPKQKAVYVWTLKGHRGTQRGTYKIEFRPGPTPDTAVAITNDGDLVLPACIVPACITANDIASISDNFRPHLVKFQYTNNKNCNIAANFPYHGDVCMLWVTGSSRFSVPQECIDHFEDICDAEVPDYDEGICGNDL